MLGEAARTHGRRRALCRGLSRGARPHRRGGQGRVSASRRASRSSCRRSTRATNGATPTRPRRPSCRCFATWRATAAPPTSTSPSTPRKPTGSSCRSTSSRRWLADDSLFANGWSGFGLAVQAYQKRAVPLIDWVVDARPQARPQADGPAGQGRLLGHRDQGRAGRRAGRLSGVHPQGRDRRLLPRLRQAHAGGDATAIYPGLRHPQRQHHRRDQGAGRQGAPLRVPAPPRHGRGALRRARAARTRDRRAADPGAHLRPGRQPQGTARLPRPPAARERRQQLVRQPHRRRATFRSTRWSAIPSPTSRRSSPSAIRRSRCPMRSSATAAATAPASTCQRSAGARTAARAAEGA